MISKEESLCTKLHAFHFWNVFFVVGNSVIFWLWHHLLIVALGLLTLLGLVIYLVVSGIRQKTSLKLSGQSSFSVPALLCHELRDYGLK